MVVHIKDIANNISAQNYKFSSKLVSIGICLEMSIQILV